MKALITLLIAFSCMLIMTDTADARRRSGQKTGFTFGATVLSAEGTNQISPNESSNKNRTIERNLSGVAPYIGYSFGTITVGTRFSSKTETVKHNEVDADNNEQKSILSTSTDSSDISLFSRLNFGEILYLEAGIGLYEQKTHIDNQNVVETSSNTFQGSKEEYKLNGVGTGHHTAIGFEVPVGSGFHFNGNVTFRNFEIRTNEGGPAFGDKQSTHKERDLNFGLSYYFK